MKPLKLELNQSVWRSWAKTWAQTPENDLAGWWGEVRVEEKPFTHLLYFDTVEWSWGALPRAPSLVNMHPIFCSRQWGLARGPAHWFWIPSRPAVIYSAPSFTSLCKLPGEFLLGSNVWYPGEKDPWKHIPGLAAAPSGFVQLPASHLWIAWLHCQVTSRPTRAVTIATFPEGCSPV